MKKTKLKKWAERHALLIAGRFFLSAILPMTATIAFFAGLALAALIILIALSPDTPIA